MTMGYDTVVHVVLARGFLRGYNERDEVLYWRTAGYPVYVGDDLVVAIRVDVGGFIVRSPLGPRRGGEAAAPCMSAYST